MVLLTVKGLWEKRPDNWPDDIPYCDPNNSNRGSGDGTGKPKKETLHKMFNFLFDRYVQKVWKTIYAYGIVFRVVCVFTGTSHAKR